MIAFVSDISTFLKKLDLHEVCGGDGSLRLDHIGVAVRSIASARVFYEALGMSGSAEEVVEREHVRSAMFSMGESRLELIESTKEDSATGRFLVRRGEGMHHIALHVGDIDAKLESLKTQGVRLVSDTIGVGAGGHRYFFVHPASASGVLIEIVGDAEPAGKR